MWPGPYGEWGSRKYLLASLDQSLKRMGLEYVDIFYTTAPTRTRRWKRPWARWTPPSQQGKALYVGISTTRRSRPARPPRSCASWAHPA